LGDAVGPIRVHRQRARAAYLVEAGTHPAAGLSGLNPPIPRGFRVLSLAENTLGNFARGLVAHLMTAGAAIRVDDIANPFALASDAGSDTVSAGPRAGEIALGRYLQ